jgi:hypothetical protein
MCARSVHSFATLTRDLSGNAFFFMYITKHLIKHKHIGNLYARVVVLITSEKEITMHSGSPDPGMPTSITIDCIELQKQRLLALKLEYLN